MRTGGMSNLDFGVLVHALIGTIKRTGSRVHLSGTGRENRAQAMHYAPR